MCLVEDSRIRKETMVGGFKWFSGLGLSSKRHFAAKLKYSSLSRLGSKTVKPALCAIEWKWPSLHETLEIYGVAHGVCRRRRVKEVTYNHENCDLRIWFPGLMAPLSSGLPSTIFPTPLMLLWRCLQIFGARSFSHFSNNIVSICSQKLLRVFTLLIMKHQKHLSLVQRNPWGITAIVIESLLLGRGGIALGAWLRSRVIQGLRLCQNDYAALLVWLRNNKTFCTVDWQWTNH